MTMKNSGATGAGTVRSPKYYEGPTDISGDVHVRIRFFTYQTDEGLVAGRNTSHMLTFNRPAKAVWPYAKDFNLWQNPYGFYYSGVVGDLEGKSFHISSSFKPVAEGAESNRYEALLKASKEKPDPSWPRVQSPFKYDVIKVVPEHLIVIHQPVPEDPSTTGGVSPGFHVITLNEHAGKTVMTMYTEHSTRSTDKTEEQALAPYRESADETVRKFRDNFLPTLKKLVYEGTA